MFNKIFAGTENELYKEMAIKNIDFALISLGFIMEERDIEFNIYFDEHTYYFYYIQNLLAACGNISNIFANPWRRNDKAKGTITPYQRSKILREQFGIDLREYPLVFVREARNSNMHFDERYDDFFQRIGDYNLLDQNTPPQDREIILNTPHLRTYDKVNQIYITQTRKGQRLEIKLVDLQNQLINLKNRLRG